MTAGRPRKLVDDVDLFRWYQKNHNTPAMWSREADGTRLKNFDGALVERQASIWFMHQFDTVIMYQAMTNKKPTSLRVYHQPDSWGLYRIIRKMIEMLEDPEVAPVTKVGLMERLRDCQRVGAAMHREFLQSGLKPRTVRDAVSVEDESPEVPEDEEIADPIILKMNREAVS